MSRFLILAVVLVAGCEQLKSPERIHELESRVDKLTDEVAALKAGSGSAARSGQRTGSGSAEPAADGSGAGSADPSAGSGSEGGSGADVAAAGSGAGSAEPAAAGAQGSGSAANEARPGGEQVADHPPVDAGTADGGAGDKATDRALAELRAVMASATGGKPGQPALTLAATRAPTPAPAVPAGLPEWSYDGKYGPPTWGTLDPAWRACMAGKAQSPVDIEPRAGTASPITFHYKPTAATVLDDGHTLQIVLAPGSTIEVDGHAYQLLQAHFHAPSEHTIAGEHYPLEAHLVHQDGDGRIAVIGVMYDSGSESKALGEVWARWPRKVGGEDRLRKPFDPSSLLPDTRTVFRYTGSLTTPPCTEGVVWNVMRRAMTDSKAHLDEFARHYPHNARDLQPLGGRKVE